MCVPVLRAGAIALSLVVGSFGIRAAHANPASLVPSAADPGDPIDLHLRLDYEYQLDRSLITRERVGLPTADPLGGIPRRKDLSFHQYRHVLTPRAELGIYRDTWVSLALPVTITQARELTLASGVDRAHSSTLLDGLLPADGFDAQDPGTPPAGNLVFRGVNRSGLDQIHLGLAVAPMSQKRDDTKPTWKMGAELRLAVGKLMKFDPQKPDEGTGVSRGVHEIRVWSSIDKQFRWTEGWFEMFWQAPFGEKSGSLFSDPGFGATNVKLAQQAGVSFGLEAYAINDRENGNRISLDVGSRLVGHFEGREYSELWEVFAYAGDSRGGGPLVLDRDPLDSGVQPMSHPGISNIENYLETAGHFAVRAAIGPRVRFAAIVDVAWKTDHVITFADAGIDKPTCSANRTTNCETENNDVVNPGTNEVNPLHAPRVDLVGHRYFSQDNFGLVVGVQGQVLF